MKNQNNTKESLREQMKQKAMDMNTNIKLAKGRDKADDLPIGEIVNLDNYEFATTVLEGKESEFVAFTLKEYPKVFYFGGSVVTDCMHQFSEEEKALIMEEGIPVMFQKIKSKTKGHNDYTKIIFYPEENM